MNIPPIKKRRWLQFNLLLMLAIVALCAVVFAWLRHPVAQTRHEVELATKIEGLGGRITWGGLTEGRGKHGRSYIGAIDLSATNVSDEDLAEIGKLPELTHLHLNDTNITDSGVKHLSAVPRLKQLELSGTKITDDGMRHILDLTSLEVVKLERCTITDDALETIGRLELLWMLHLDSTSITDDASKHLVKLRRLRTLG